MIAIKRKLLVIVLALFMLSMLHVPKVAAVTYSEESIDGFSQTIDEDVWLNNEFEQFVYTNDFLEGTEPSTGDTDDLQDYEGVNVCTWAQLDPAVPLWIPIEMSFPLQYGTEFEEFVVSVSADAESFDSVLLYFWNYQYEAWGLVGQNESAVDTGYFTNITVDTGSVTSDAHYFDGSLLVRVVFYLFPVPPAKFVLCPAYYEEFIDYACLTVNDSDGFQESFSDANDWYLYSQEGQDNYSSDGDVLSWVVSSEPADGTTSDYLTTDVPTGTYQYIEILYRFNTSLCNAVSIYARTDAIPGGTPTSVSGGLTPTETWTTKKYYVGSISDFDTLYFYCYPNNHVNFTFYVDYVRLVKSNEMGWSHDCSTTDGVTIGVGTASLDGDKITFSSYSGTGYFDFYIDSTATAAKLQPSYYPMLSWTISSVIDADSDGNTWLIRVYDSGSWLIPQGWSDDTGTFYCNLEAGNTGTISQFRFYVDEGDTYSLDLVQAYSIANYTITQSASLATNEYAFVENDMLNLTKTTTNYMIFDHQPTLSISESIYNQWFVNITFADEREPYSWYWAVVYSGGSTSYTTEATNGSMPSGKTVTDFSVTLYTDTLLEKILFIDAHEWHLAGEANIYFDLPNWHEIGEAVIGFSYFREFQGTLDFWMVLLGACMIPSSTAFLALNRHNMDRNKLLLFLLMFVLGWGMLLTGVL